MRTNPPLNSRSPPRPIAYQSPTNPKAVISLLRWLYITSMERVIYCSGGRKATASAASEYSRKIKDIRMDDLL